MNEEDKEIKEHLDKTHDSVESDDLELLEFEFNEDRRRLEENSKEI